MNTKKRLEMYMDGWMESVCITIGFTKLASTWVDGYGYKYTCVNII